MVSLAVHGALIGLIGVGAYNIQRLSYAQGILDFCSLIAVGKKEHCHLGLNLPSSKARVGLWERLKTGK